MGMLNSGACDVSRNPSTEEHGAGDVVSFGAGDRGQLGLGGKDDEWTPRVIEPLTGEGPRASDYLCIDPIDTYLKMFVVSQWVVLAAALHFNLLCLSGFL